MSSSNNSIAPLLVNNSSNNTGLAVPYATMYCSIHGGNCAPADIIIYLLSIIGITANVTVFVTMMCSRRLRKPIYFGIGLLTLPDAIFLLTTVLRLTFIYLQARSKMLTRIRDTISVTSYFSSVSHMILLSWQQYIYLAHPIKSHIWFTIRRLILISTAVWIFSISLSMLYMCMLIFYAEHIANNLKKVFLQTVTIVTTVLPVLLLFLLFILKTQVLKASLTDHRSGPVKKMSRIVGRVVWAFILFTLPLNIWDVLEYCLNFRETTIIEVFYTQISRILYTCNFTANPFIYFFLTPLCRKSFNRKNSDRESADTHHSRVRMLELNLR